MANEEDVLLAQIAALEKNIERMRAVIAKEEERRKSIESIRLLLDEKETDAALILKQIRMLLAGEGAQFRNPVLGKFERVINPPKNRLKNLKKAVADKKLEPQEAWQKYRDDKQIVQRALDLCLEYIGGVAVRRWRMDEGICDFGEYLVSENLKQGASWGSVTIVGAKGFFHPAAQTTQIIRLRFPEWDIWSLPFIAYEFGRWIVGEEYIEGIKEFFKEEKDRMLRLITVGDVTTLVEIGDLTKDEIEDGEIKNLAPEFRALRADYQTKTQSAEEVGRTIDQKSDWMKELFANAFATYFLGPAYAYAQVCLRLDPIEALQDRPLTPSLACRVGLMLQMLREMNEEKREEYDKGPYEAACQRLETQWERTIQTLQPGYKAAFDYGPPYSRWASRLYNIFKTTYSDKGFSHDDWKAAKELGTQFGKDDPSIGSSVSLPVILNAAWHSRALDSTAVDRIEKHARKAMQAVSETATSTPTGAGPKPGPTSSGRDGR